MKWKRITGFQYYVSSTGLIKNKVGVTLNNHQDTRGYQIAFLYKEGKRFCLKVHRLVYQAFKGDLKKGYVIDHINNNPLDNRVENLQQITQRQNANKNPSSLNPTSSYPGVSWDSKNKKWVAQIKKRKKHYFLGRFSDELEASKAYADKAFQLDN